MTSRLASLLVQEAVISAKKMAEAFQRQVIYGGTLDTILLEMDIIDESALIDALGRASQLPTAGDLPSAEALQAAGASRWFPHSVCERYRAVPISLDGNVLRVLVTDPVDRRQLDELGFMLSLSVDPIVVPEHRFMQAVELVYHVALPARFQSLSGKLRQRAASAPPPPRPALPSDPMLAKVADLAAAMTPPVEKPVVDKPVERAFEAPVERAFEAPVEPPLVEPPVEKGVERPIDGAPEEPVRRAVVTDVPLPSMRGAPEREMPESPTPRLTTRQASAPAAPIVTEVVRQVQDQVGTLSLEQAMAELEQAADRDAIFETVCRGARSELAFVALFTVQGEQALGRLALSITWAPKEIVGRISVPLERASALQTTVRTLAPFLGRLGDEPISLGALQALGRRAPLFAVLLPIVLRERTVALVYGDASGQAIDGAIVGGLSTLAAAAARAFQRLILKQKGGDYSKGPSNPSGKMGAAAAEPARGGSWRSAKEPTAGKARAAAGGLAAALGMKEMQAPRSPLHEMPTQQIRQIDGPDRQLDMEALIGSVMMHDGRAQHSAEALLALGERGALAVVARMPGPLKLARLTLRGPTPPLSEHGSLLALIARFGALALDPLRARLNDPSVDVRWYAVLAVGELKAPEAVGALGQRLLDRDPSVRQVATEALARYGDTPAIRGLTESLRSELPGPDAGRQEHAAEALGGLKDTASVPRLIELVKHPDEAVVAAARRALVDITKQDFGTSRWRWRSWWERHRSEPRLEWMLEGLGHAEAEVRESASEELRHLSKENFGYHFDLPKREREEARRQWVDWWRTQKKN